jgi:hypothetical protein
LYYLKRGGGGGGGEDGGGGGILTDATYEILLRIGSSGGLCKHGNETSGSINKIVLFDKLSNYKLFK